jgi:hypothetical protein
MGALQTYAVAGSIFCSLTLAVARAANELAPDDLSKWDLVCFCSAEHYTPHRVLEADSNGRILFYARNGATKQQLVAHGVVSSDSQLIVLEDWSLLAKQGDVYTTHMPVIGPEPMAALRELLRGPAARAVAETRDDVVAIAATLAQAHLADHTFSVVFSYVLDGLVWDRLKARAVFPSNTITAEHPHWNGSFYAFYPKRVGVPGTNGSAEGHLGVDMTWNSETVAALGRLQASAEFRTFLRARNEGLSPADAIATTDGIWRLTDAGGKLRVPLIEDSAGDPIHDRGSRIADVLATRLLDADTMTTIRKTIPNAGGQEVIVAAHEFIWSVLDEMLAQGALRRPPAMQPGARQTPEALLPLLTFIHETG